MSQPPPQKQMSLPNSRFSRSGSMSRQVVCTGLITSKPASIRSGSSAWIEPHECRKVFIFECLWT